MSDLLGAPAPWPTMTKEAMQALVGPAEPPGMRGRDGGAGLARGGGASRRGSMMYMRAGRATDAAADPRSLPPGSPYVPTVAPGLPGRPLVPAQSFVGAHAEGRAAAQGGAASDSERSRASEQERTRRVGARAPLDAHRPLGAAEKLKPDNTLFFEAAMAQIPTSK
jgi:hypothetical protein